MKISLYVWVRLKAILWKFCIVNARNSGVIYSWNSYPIHLLSTKMNSKTRSYLKIVYRIHKHVTNFKTLLPRSLLWGRHKYLLPMLCMANAQHKRWPLFYQVFEISLQLAILLIFLKLPTFSGTTFSSRF